MKRSEESSEYQQKLEGQWRSIPGGGYSLYRYWSFRATALHRHRRGLHRHGHWFDCSVESQRFDVEEFAERSEKAVLR